jgi:succinylglutamic semialdehyde dehydrogenase
MPSFPLPLGDYIAGQWTKPLTPDGEITLHSPADTNDLIATHLFALRHVDSAIDAAQRAFRPWRRTANDERDACLRRYQAALRQHAEDIAITITREVGKPLSEARGEVTAMISKIDLSLSEGRQWTPDTVLNDLPGEIRHRPLGVLTVIGPFNFPGHLPNGQIVPALAAGNTVVFKPSEKAPGTGAWIAQCIHEAGFPKGVFNLVQGQATVAQKLVQHDEIAGILFTGSLAVGKAILKANVERVDRLIALELGGKNASIVFDDADLDHAVEQVAFAAYATSGQRCTSTSRVIVSEKIADAFCSKLIKKTQQLIIGYPFDANVFMGPVISSTTRNSILDAQKHAHDSGCEVLVKGQVVDVPGHPGWYLSPSLLKIPSSNLHIPGYSDTELFGPDLAVYTAHDIDSAIELANRTPFGLVAAVFTRSTATFNYCADELEVGIVHFNRSTAGASSRLPFGGIKSSGNHRPAGIFAGRLCSYPQAILGNPGSR